MTLLDVVIIVLILAWLTGSFVIPVGSVIHLLLAVLLVVVILRVAQGRL